MVSKIMGKTKWWEKSFFLGGEIPEGSRPWPCSHGIAITPFQGWNKYSPERA
jgi:hypothetical protein